MNYIEVDIKHFINIICTKDISKLDLNKYTQRELEYLCYYIAKSELDCDIIYDKSKNFAMIIHVPTEINITCWINPNDPIKMFN